MLEETNEKIKEAEYFLKKIKDLEKNGDDDEFGYNLNAFLHAWASIFDIILEDYQRAYNLDILMSDDLSIKSFEQHAQTNNEALNFIRFYDKLQLEFFGHRDHKKILTLLPSVNRVDDFILFLLNRINWNEFGYHDCYIALYNVLQDILEWNMDYHNLIMNPLIIQRRQLGFDMDFITMFGSTLQLNGFTMNLDDLFEHNFLRQQMIRRQNQFTTAENQAEPIELTSNSRIRVQIFTIAGLIKKKRHVKTHRNSSELLQTIERFEGDKILYKSRYMNFIRENYLGEEQGMAFGHFTTPLETVETCEQMFDRAQKFVEEIQRRFPIEN